MEATEVTRYGVVGAARFPLTPACVAPANMLVSGTAELDECLLQRKGMAAVQPYPRYGCKGGRNGTNTSEGSGFKMNGGCC